MELLNSPSTAFSEKTQALFKFNNQLEAKRTTPLFLNLSLTSGKLSWGGNVKVLSLVSSYVSNKLNSVIGFLNKIFSNMSVQF